MLDHRRRRWPNIDRTLHTYPGIHIYIYHVYMIVCTEYQGALLSSTLQVYTAGHTLRLTPVYHGCVYFVWSGL